MFALVIRTARSPNNKALKTKSLAISSVNKKQLMVYNGRRYLTKVSRFRWCSLVAN